MYRRIFVADGNFKADHVRAKKPSLDEWLSEGAGFVPERTEYHKFLLHAMETSTASPFLNLVSFIAMNGLLRV